MALQINALFSPLSSPSSIVFFIVFAAAAGEGPLHGYPTLTQLPTMWIFLLCPGVLGSGRFVVWVSSLLYPWLFNVPDVLGLVPPSARLPF